MASIESAKKAIHRSRSSGSDNQATRKRNSESQTQQFALATFKTKLGWVGLLGQCDRLSSIFFAHPSMKSLMNAVRATNSTPQSVDWHPSLRELFEAYAEGEVVDFSHVEIFIPHATRFQDKVIFATRRIPYGETASYGDLASRIGHARAARAVGTVMRTNQFPIVVPCHRVLASGGKIGGYSSHAGLDLKRRLLELETAGIGR